MTDVGVAKSEGLQAIAGRWRTFARWWLAEFRALVPPRWLTWIDGGPVPVLLVWPDGDHVVFRLSAATGQVEDRLPLAGFGKVALEAWLVMRGLRRDQVVVGPVIPRDWFFRRHLAVPKAALLALPTILEQEVTRRTPFQLSDIWHAARPDAEGEGNVQSFCHWIIRRDRAEAALAELGLIDVDVDFLASSDGHGEFVPVIAMRLVNTEDPPWVRQAVKLLATVALGAAMLGPIAFEWRQASVAARLEASMAEAREGAQGGRSGGNQAARLFAMKADAGVLEIWDELSRILPDNTFLTETRIVDGKLTITGFSADAAGLVRIIDRSPQFSGATLTTSITPDATEHKDHFSINFKVRSGRTIRQVESGRSPP